VIGYLLNPRCRPISPAAPPHAGGCRRGASSSVACTATQIAWELIVRQSTGARCSTVAFKFVGKATTRGGSCAGHLPEGIQVAGNTFDRRANFKTWLISVSRNLCIDPLPQRAQGARETIYRDVDRERSCRRHRRIPPPGQLPRMAAARSCVLLRRALAELPRDAQDGVPDARHPEMSTRKLPGRSACGRHRQIAHQTGDARARAACQATARERVDKAQGRKGASTMNVKTEQAGPFRSAASAKPA